MGKHDIGWTVTEETGAKGIAEHAVIGAHQQRRSLANPDGIFLHT